jgi:SAM-dependent methyltransferase
VTISKNKEGPRATAELLMGIESYYTRRVRKYGAVPLGVDWSCVATQELRFEQLLKLCDFSQSRSLSDLGCGYGALSSYIAKHYSGTIIDYLGIDVSSAMIREARIRCKRRRLVKFVVGHTSPRVTDYAVASGIFNVKLNAPIDVWESLIGRTLMDLRATTRYGFAVNFLAPQDIRQLAKHNLYRARPAPWIQFCESQLQASVELLGNYGLREFTLLVRT